ncbi:class I SAM-dependent methyltransferase [Sinorhizobium medicae]|uniref:class I SAM-dependent methyltransferase n=1 Tax=Sinorhizobium medicae TaxID=110321 RepID=UPI000FDB0702|nr:class I SAM-dependent methyltransferase [Sinorhizobium medicae]RVH92236.1 class I SAM-dependent methyltransferase [Sinorhizobium medicae]RVP61604.1 class I SAM-dependent methyltransferase [Sinorhizobium medicae]
MEPQRSLDSVTYYDRLAAGLAPSYDAVTFDVVHANLSKHLPGGGRVLDIGSGSGRDARGLVARGLHVTAVEPSVAFRHLGEASSVNGIIWIDDRLPMLARLDGVVEPFDFILCSAVLMLLSPSDLRASFQTMARLLARHGRLAVDIRDPMPGEPAAIFHSHPEALILEAAGAAGLVCIDYAERNDALGRPEYLWRSYVFAYPTE